MELESERLCYRSPTMTDTEDIREIGRQKTVIRWLHLPLPVDRADVQERILAYQPDHVHPLPLFFVIVEKRSQRVIGWIDLHHQSSFHTMELGYALHPHWQHRGHMREALEWMLTYGFVTLDLHRINAWCAAENTASIALLERLHFRAQGCLPKRQRLGDGCFHAMALYSLMREEWRKPYDKTACSQI